MSNHFFLNFKTMFQKYLRSINSVGGIFLCFNLLACSSIAPIPTSSSTSSGGATINIPGGSVNIPGGISIPTGSSTTSSDRSASGGPVGNGEEPSLEELDSNLENSLDDFDSRVSLPRRSFPYLSFDNVITLPFPNIVRNRYSCSVAGILIFGGH